MADEAFALSPISARASQPREEDYEAISDAFMETSRGRWFLTEYARRNRNADTRMVLDAVARIEESLAAQKQPPPHNALPEALAAIKSAVDDAKGLVSAALDDLAPEQTLAPVRKGARVIREIAWRLREIGADGRICDLIDSQVSVIETGCGELASASPMAAIGAAFDLIAARIGEFDDGDAASPQAKAGPTPSPAPSDETMPDNEEDDAILDMIALEMAAADPSDDDEFVAADETGIMEPPPAAPETVGQMPEPVAASAPPPPVQPSIEPPSPQASPEVSLGATLIANGIVRRPHAPASDPMAPIRRMSQAEKIAFFS